jgi:hypothetical protein
MMDSFEYYAWNSISFFIFCYMHKGQEGPNAETCYEFGNDLMNMCFKHKTRMKVDDGIKDVKILLNCISIM